MAEASEVRPTVATRVARDPAFARTLLDVAVALPVGGEPGAARRSLPDLASATAGLEPLAIETRKPANSLHRMPSTDGDPR